MHTRSRFVILIAIERSSLIKFSKRTDKPLRGKVNAFCQFYNNFGHFTNIYHKLMNQIVVLIMEWELGEFVDIEAWRDEQTNYLKGKV